MTPATNLLGDVVADVDFLVVQQHAVDRLDSGVGGSSGFVVNETVALGAAVLVGGNLAGENVTECRKGVMKGLVVDGVVQVLDEDVALAGLAEGGVTLGPHDTAKMPVRVYCAYTH